MYLVDMGKIQPCKTVIQWEYCVHVVFDSFLVLCMEHRLLAAPFLHCFLLLMLYKIPVLFIDDISERFLQVQHVPQKW